jgi:hypothetical protein
MTAITTSAKPTSTTTTTSTRSRRFRRGVVVGVAAIVVVASAIALTVWLLVQSPTHHANVTTPPLTNVQKIGVAGAGGNPAAHGGGKDQCQPLPGQRFC